MSESDLTKCKRVLAWYRAHGYLLGAQSKQGETFRKVEHSMRKAFECLPEQLRPIFIEHYVSGIANYDLLEQLATSKTQFYVHKQKGLLMLVEIIGRDKLGELIGAIGESEASHG